MKKITTILSGLAALLITSACAESPFAIAMKSGLRPSVNILNAKALKRGLSGSNRGLINFGQDLSYFSPNSFQQQQTPQNCLATAQSAIANIASSTGLDRQQKRFNATVALAGCLNQVIQGSQVGTMTYPYLGGATVPSVYTRAGMPVGYNQFSNFMYGQNQAQGWGPLNSFQQTFPTTYMFQNY